MKRSATVKKTDGKFVIENKKGEVVRSLDWQGIKLHIVYRHDTRRIETTDDIKSLKDQKIEFTSIEIVRKSDVQKRPVDIDQVGTLRYLENIDSLSPSPKTVDDDIKPLIGSIKWIGGVSTSLLFLLFIIAYFFKPEVEEVRVVEIIERPVQEKTKEVVPKQKIRKQVVRASRNKKVSPRQARAATVRKVKVTNK
ncbi:MAG: hypothetical protein KDD37_11820, partial [Bdellovibrionales bacterium]|nr:hypothetical protein [Bdellovibrionales bacterium]